MVLRSLIAACCLALLLAAVPARAADPIGQVKDVAGEAFVEGPSGRRPARLGDDVYESDTLVTGADGSIGITFMDDSRFSAGPNSRIALESFAYDPTTQAGEFVARVEGGTLAVTSGRLAKASPEAMKVKLRGRILGVRGTRFLVRATM